MQSSALHVLSKRSTNERTNRVTVHSQDVTKFVMKISLFLSLEKRKREREKRKEAHRRRSDPREATVPNDVKLAEAARRGREGPARNAAKITPAERASSHVTRHGGSSVRDAAAAAVARTRISRGIVVAHGSRKLRGFCVPIFKRATATLRPDLTALPFGGQTSFLGVFFCFFFLSALARSFPRVVPRRSRFFPETVWWRVRVRKSVRARESVGVSSRPSLDLEQGGQMSGAT